MNIQHIQNKLSEKYLNIFQYFGYSFITFKELIFDSNNMWWILFFFAFNLMDSAITMILPQYDFSFYHEISPYFRIFYYLFLFLFFKKIIYKIEDNYSLNLGASAQKFLSICNLFYLEFCQQFSFSFLTLVSPS